MKKRRADAKLRIEGLSEIEEAEIKVQPQKSQKENIQGRGARPISSYRPIPVNGDCFGEVLELWGFLVTFSEPLSIKMVPSLFKLLDAFRFSDPFIRTLCHRAMPHSRAFDNVVMRHRKDDPFEKAFQSIKDARTLLNKIGVALTRPLLPEFFKLMGMESEIQAEAAKFVVHELSWMEIAR